MCTTAFICRVNSVTVTRRVASMTIVLSKDPLDSSLPGYQPPLPDSEVVPQRPEGPGSAQRGARGGRGRGRGGRGGRGRGK